MLHKIRLFVIFDIHKKVRYNKKAMENLVGLVLSIHKRVTGIPDYKAHYD